MKDRLVLETVPFEEAHFKQGGITVPLDMDAGNWGDAHAVTVLLNGTPAVIMGVYQLWEGVFEASIAPGNLFLEHKKSCIREIKTWLENALKVFKWHRIQVTTDMRNPSHQRFVRLFGFQEEAVLKAYTKSGSDVVISAITKEA